ncbi:radical SAM protein [Anaerotruncus colihominis]|uniref:Radical SAM protein n=1 Tax=Anaerotruncus colihominis TaxID=169435 RepID=A0A845RKS3_9FIRM|nr:radical SAM protein [Anaerotruncus colihominis]NBI79425.1 radical SAM protein [Anaerotruncus colihominis]
MNAYNCTLCPRRCGADRVRGTGFCGGGNHVRAARAALHTWEEPCISGTRGSGTVFFSGCALQCCFCQNHEISAGRFGKELTVQQLADIFLSLQKQGAHNINLVNPTHFAPWAARAVRLARPRLRVPVVCNTGGYESMETLRALESMIDVYLPDFKYVDARRSARYSGAADYFKVVSAALPEMLRQVGRVEMDVNGVLQKGLLIRHLVLPKGVEDSIAVLEWIASNLPRDEILISLMAQYTPSHHSARYPEIDRRVSTYEYNRVLQRARELGLNGYMQERASACAEFTPTFRLEGL